MKNISILDNRVKDKSGYKLIETLESINKTTSLNESKLFNTLRIAIMALLDDFTGEWAGAIAMIPTWYYNVNQISNTNEEIEYILQSTSRSKEDIQKLKELRKDLMRDLIDLLNSIILLVPALGADSVVIMIIQALQNQIASKVPPLLEGFITAKFEEISHNNPKLAKLLNILSWAAGGGVIMQAFRNIDKLSPPQIEYTLGIRVDQQNDILDVESETIPIPDDFDDDTTEIIPRRPIPMNENHIPDRWSELSGLQRKNRLILKESESPESLKILKEMKKVHEGLITDLIDAIQSIIELLPTELLMQADLPLVAGEYAGGAIAQFAGGNLISKLGKLLASTRSADRSSVTRTISELAPIFIALPSMASMPVVAPLIKIILDSLECIGNLGSILDESDSSFSSYYDVSFTKIAKELLGDAIPSAIDAVDRTGIIDGLVGAGRLLWNCKQLWSGTSKGEKLIEEYMQNSLNNIEQFETFMDTPPPPPLSESIDLNRWKVLSGIN